MYQAVSPGGKNPSLTRFAAALATQGEPCDGAADAQLEAPERLSFNVEDNVVGGDQALVRSDQLFADLLAGWEEFIARGRCWFGGGRGGGRGRLPHGRLRPRQRRRNEDHPGCCGSQEFFRTQRRKRETVWPRSLPPVDTASCALGLETSSRPAQPTLPGRACQNGLCLVAIGNQGAPLHPTMRRSGHDRPAGK
jgi:hypothetical protein